MLCAAVLSTIVAAAFAGKQSRFSTLYYGMYTPGIDVHVDIEKAATRRLEGLEEHRPSIQEDERSVSSLCNKASPYRTLDGSCNNLNHPRWGAAMTPFQRLLPAEYDSLLDHRPRGMKRLVSPRTLSQLLHTEEHKPDRRITHMVMQFGQFLDHDFALTMESEVHGGCCPAADHPECFPIHVTDDPFFTAKDRKPAPATCLEHTRSSAFPGAGGNGTAREQFTAITAFLDASNVYGSDGVLASKLRSKSGGRLLTGDYNLLPRMEGKPTGGDKRATEQPGLTSMHAIWMREHNRLAGVIEGSNPHFSDEEIYQTARRQLIAEWQNIIFSEWLPIIIGPAAMRKYQLDAFRRQETRYDPGLNPSIINSFAGAAFRFGHSLIQGSFDLVSRDGQPLGQFQLREHYNDKDGAFYSSNKGATMEEIIKGLASQNSQSFDSHATEDVSNHLFQPKGHNFGQDLISRNIQRGRDHGLPSYAKFRSLCGGGTLRSLKKHPSGMNKKMFKIAQAAYKNVEDIDLFTGGHLEDRVPGGVVGPTFACIIGEQFRRLMYGDRYFFSHAGEAGALSREDFTWASKRTMRDVLCDNTDIDSFQANVFLKDPSYQLPCIR